MVDLKFGLFHNQLRMIEREKVKYEIFLLLKLNLPVLIFLSCFA